MLSTKLNFLQNWTHIDLNINLNQAKMIEAAIIYSYVCFYSMSIPLFVHLKKKTKEKKKKNLFSHLFFQHAATLPIKLYKNTILKNSIKEIN